MSSLDELEMEIDLNETDLDEGFFDKIKKLGDAGSKAKVIFDAFKKFRSENAYEVTMALLELIPDTNKELKGKAKKIKDLLDPFKEGLSKIKDANTAKLVLNKIGEDKLKQILDTDAAEPLKDLKAFIVKNEEKIKQALQIIKNKDIDKIQQLVGFEFPNVIKKKAKPLLDKLSTAVEPQTKRISGFMEFLKSLPINNEGLASVLESRNLFRILPEDILNESLGILSEECAAIADDLLAVDISSVETFPLVPTEDKGRMLDYGGQKSGSKEGRMAKSKLYSMARMAQSLESRLQDKDDLPEWVQNKITTAEDRLSSVYDYLDYKLHRMKIDGEKLTENKLRKLVRQGILRG